MRLRVHETPPDLLRKTATGKNLASLAEPFGTGTARTATAKASGGT